MKHLIIAFMSAGIASPLSAAPPSHPVIPGLIREGPDPRMRGAVLLAELNCASCHSTSRKQKMIRTKMAPDLSAVGARVQPEYLKAFISQPQKTKPGTTMPDVWQSADDSTREASADALTHYLLSLGVGRVTLEAPDRIAAIRGRKLFHSIGCVACHSPRTESGAEISPDDSAPLGFLERKYSVSSLTSFLENPHLTRPSGRMPDLRLTPEEAYQLANYLTSRTRVSGPLAYTLYLGEMHESLERLRSPELLRRSEAEAGLARGFDLESFAKYQQDFAVFFEGYLEIETAGEYSFTLDTSFTGRLKIAGEYLIDLPKAGNSRASLQLSVGLHPIELLYSHAKGKPLLKLEWSGPGIERGPVPQSRLRSEKQPLEARPSFIVDAEKAKTGKRLFQDLRCGQCHKGIQDPPENSLPLLADVDTTEGCLSSSTGSWPLYSLSDQQVGDIRATLGDRDFKPTRTQKVESTLATLNCIACHERDGWGGVPQNRNEFYTGADPNMGETGRIPPPLTGVGAKLQLEWLSKAIANGQSLRPYLSLRMPAFGEDNTRHLALLFESLDTLPPVDFEDLPSDRKKARAVTDIGHRLIGNKGMSCVTCHTFRSRSSSAMKAIDLAETTTQRLRKDWFYHYLLQPLRFRSATIMPEYFPEGVSTLADIADGDPKKQINAMWHYLSAGRNTRMPSGIQRPSMEIVVGDEAVMLRRSVQDTGKRGISVGYPGGVNLTFDAESLSLNQVWRGKFLDPGGVWSGQGSGSARIMSRDRVRLGRGAPIAILKDASTPWPTNDSRDLGIRFKGYDLDDVRRPTFHYVFGDISIADKPLDRRGGDLADGNDAYLERTLTFRCEEDRTLFFRVAAHPEVEEFPDGRIKIARKLALRARIFRESAWIPLRMKVREAAKNWEVIVPVTIREGKAALMLEYRWMEKAK